MSNRSLKLKLYEENPFCYWCKEPVILTNESNLHGHPNPKMATIDHVVSRFYPHRWLKRKKGQKRKVLACYECNHNRCVQETLCLSRHEILQRSKGFSLSPRGNPKIIKPLPTIREVKKVLNA
jgi:hypothetical protein